MYDKINIRAKIDTRDIGTIVLRNYLEEYTRGDEVFYRSTSYSHLTGITIDISGDILRCKCSVNKLFYKGLTGYLDNSQPMTFGNAVRTIRNLLMRLCVREEDAVVTYYEIGLTMVMAHSPDVYIRAAESGTGKVFWNDPNYPEMRQKVTEKSKYYRKILKMYDKTYEYAAKGKVLDKNVLRLETVYKHQAVPMPVFLDSAFQLKQAKKFYSDWSGVRFLRELKPTKGVKLSQLVKAREIHRIGVDAYLDKYRQMWKDGELSKKSWQSIREYGHAWPSERQRYEEMISAEEEEYQNNLLRFYQVGIVTSYS